MNLNLFQWIREGVRHSVMQGVADAVDQIGTPPNEDNLSARLGDYLRANVPESPVRGRVEAGAAPIRNKRLGRSLKDFAEQEKKPSGG